jgi:ABC-type oligopeptide transport system substrate-binding subunit
MKGRVDRFSLLTAVGALLLWSMTGCSTSASSRYFGKTTPPADNVLRYVSGGEPESLDPAVSNSQGDARIDMALYDGLVEYDPQTLDPIPSLAKAWKITEQGTEYVFDLRETGKFSNGTPITAHDFVFTIRRGFSPELASRNASLGYYIKYAEAYNAKKSFVKCGDRFLTKNGGASAANRSGDFHSFLDQPELLSVPGDEQARNAVFDADATLKRRAAGCDFVRVLARDIGVEAVDDHTLRIKLSQPAPYFLGLLGHQFFRVVSKDVVEKFGLRWTRPENIVTSGSFKLIEHLPYDRLVVGKDPNNWDAANVHLDRIEFYPIDEQATIMNLYKSGGVDATYNHTIPSAWFDTISQYRDEHLFHPENASEFYVINTKKAPMDLKKVREAFALAIDRDAFASLKKTYKPLVDAVPFGVFPAYEKARDKVYPLLLAKQGMTIDEWKARKFDPVRARQLLSESGYPVSTAERGWSCPTFPVDKVSILFNTSGGNGTTAEFIQAQWKQNLGLTVQLVNMEQRTFLPMVDKLEYQGAARFGWSGDYMDPYSFLYLYYSPKNASATGWWDPHFDEMLDEANKEIDAEKRLEKLAAAEFYLMQQHITIPLGVPGTNWLKKPYVKGMYPNPGTLHPWKFVYIERDSSKWDTETADIMAETDPRTETQVKRLKAGNE